MRVSHPNDAYESVHRQFAWTVPAKFNMAEVCCGRWARSPQHRHSVAIIEHQVDGRTPRTWTYWQLQAAADQLSLQLLKAGVKKGDRVAIVMPQRFETAVSYMAVLQMGAVAMPLSMLFGPDALAFRVDDSGAAVALCDETSAPVLHSLKKACRGLKTIFDVPQELINSSTKSSGKNLVKGRIKPLPPDKFKPVIFFDDAATTEIYTLTLHDAVPIDIRSSNTGQGTG